jgi:hypothetical protein
VLVLAVFGIGRFLPVLLIARGLELQGANT